MFILALMTDLVYGLDLLMWLNTVGDYEVNLRVNIIQGPLHLLLSIYC